MAYELRSASLQDEPWLERLRREVYHDLFDTTFGGWDEERHKRQFAECLSEGGISIIVVAGEPVGMIQRLDESGGIRIAEIQIAIGHQNQGIGTHVLTDLIAAAHQEQKVVRLSLGRKNHGAYRLYRRLGFQEVGQSSSHLQLVSEPAAFYEGESVKPSSSNEASGD